MFTEGKGTLFLDVVVGEGATIFELFTGEDQVLLARGDTPLALMIALVLSMV